MTEQDKDNSNDSLEPKEDTNVASEFSYLYKNTGKNPSLSQQERRDLLLKEQKEKRHSLVDSHRNFTELLVEEENEYNEETTEDMDVEANYQRRQAKLFQMMKSEWFCEVPEDLEENWLFKIAPEGFRVFVIAKKCRTVVLNEKGKVLTLKTHLPGGGLDKTSGLTVIDCIYNKVTKTLFVLDCLYWNTMSMLDSETNFRFYWLKNKFDENSKLTETNKPHKIQMLDFLPAHRSLIQQKVFEPLSVSKHKVPHEGVVFYHKELHYTFGETPLLGWLFCYMLPEKLGIDVPQENITKMPSDYECLETYLETLSQRKAEKKNYREKRLEQRNMDVS